MCRLLGYLGTRIRLDRLMEKPEHSLIVQSYQPHEMTAGLLNADGFGIGWYDRERSSLPYIYKNILPIWSDINLPHLNRYIESDCFLAYVRSATPGLPVDLINCQPFERENLLFVHNGYIDNFRNTLYRPIRNELCDATYRSIHGTTDSEHIFALIISQLRLNPEFDLATALAAALIELTKLAQTYNTFFSANIILSDGDRLVACRYSNRNVSPTLYYLEDPEELQGTIVVSEPLFAGNWKSCPDRSIISVSKDFELSIHPLS